jgi:hypothetical protein
MEHVRTLQAMIPGESLYDTSLPKSLIKASKSDTGETEYLLYKIIERYQHFHGFYQKDELDLLIRDAKSFEKE